MPKAKSIDPVKVDVQIQETTLEDLISRGMELREKTDHSYWDYGDLAIETTDLYGPKALAIVAQGIIMPISTLRRYRDVAKAYPLNIREEFAMLSWSHFKQLAGNPDRFLILKRAHDENWSFEKLCAMTKPDKSRIIDDGKFVPAKPEMKFCIVCRKWYLEDPKSVCDTQGHCVKPEETAAPTTEEKPTA